MIVPDGFDAAVAAGLQAAFARALRAIADDVPGDVAVRAVGRDIVLTGRDLSIRALADPRLRDFAALVR